MAQSLVTSTPAKAKVMTPAQPWVSSQLDPEQIQAKEVWILDKTGRKIKGRLEVEEASAKGQLVVQAQYTSSPHPNSMVFAAFRLTQEQMDDFARKGEVCVLKIPDRNSNQENANEEKAKERTPINREQAQINREPGEA